MGNYGRDEWPIRAPDVSWSAWVNGATENSASVMAIPNQDEGGEWDWIVSGNDSGGDVAVKSLETIRSQRADLTESDGVGASDGWVNGAMSMSGLNLSLMIHLVQKQHLLAVGPTLQEAIWTGGLEMQTHLMSTL